MFVGLPTSCDGASQATSDATYVFACCVLMISLMPVPSLFRTEFIDDMYEKILRGPLLFPDDGGVSTASGRGRRRRDPAPSVL